ncbi:hypothetical protein G7054_g5375 [Neopestalotiopsis clavispora]|nr:hypothetical protein G7054_g5375 [Neopestalotiopsis clavispora]
MENLITYVLLALGILACAGVFYFYTILYSLWRTSLELETHYLDVAASDYDYVEGGESEAAESVGSSALSETTTLLGSQD